MSLKRCVICIAGDISEDMFAPFSWTEKGGALDRKKIESWFEGKALKIVWEKMDKSVTHLVISRNAFRHMHAAVQFVRKDRRDKKKAKIVTYDWLEDSLEDNRAIQDVSAYDPGKPRDIPAILRARRKDAKTGKVLKATEGMIIKDTAIKNKTSRETGPPVITDKAYQRRQDPTKRSESKGIRSATSALNTAESDAERQPKPISGGKTSVRAVSKSSHSEMSLSKSVMSMSVVSKSNPSKPLPAHTKLPSLTPGAQVAIQKSVAIENVKRDPIASWVANAKARIYRDKTDQFPYSIDLKHKNHKQNGEYWNLTIWESHADPVKKSFMFCANRYQGKSTIPIHKDCRNPVCSSQEALKYLAETFRMRMSYNWDERLVRAGGDQPSNWRYELRADGKTGKTPLEYTPGNQNCKKLEDLAPIRRDKKSQVANQGSIVRKAAPAFPRSLERDNILKSNRMSQKTPNVSGQRNTERVKTSTSGSGMKKAHKPGSTPTSLKRKAEDPPAASNQYSKTFKVSRVSKQFKSVEYINVSDDDSE